MFCGHGVSPFYGTWVANAVPEHIRARFTSRQTILSTVTAMISGFAIGQFIDLFRGGSEDTGFLWVFTVGTIFGLLGHFNLLRAPFPREEHARDSHPKLADLIEPFRDANFLRAVLFYGLWTLALGLAGPSTAFLCWTDCRFLTRKFLFSMPVLWRRVLQAIAYGQASLIASAVKPFYRSWSYLRH